MAILLLEKLVEYVVTSGRSNTPDVSDYGHRYETKFYDKLSSRLRGYKGRGRVDSADEVADILIISRKGPYRIQPKFPHEFSYREVLVVEPGVLGNSSAYWFSFSHRQESANFISNILAFCISGNLDFYNIRIDSVKDCITEISKERIYKLFHISLSELLEEYLENRLNLRIPLPSWELMYMGGIA